MKLSNEILQTLKDNFANDTVGPNNPFDPAVVIASENHKNFFYADKLIPGVELLSGLVSIDGDLEYLAIDLEALPELLNCTSLQLLSVSEAPPLSEEFK